MYKERRKSVLNELKIKEVQKRAVNKILNKEENEAEFLFFRRSYDSSINDMSDMLSEDFGDEKYEDESHVELDTMSQIPDSSGALSHTRLVAGNEGRKRSRVYKFVDVEAEGSEDESQDGSEDDGGCLDDPSFIAKKNKEYEAPAKKHNEDLLRMNENMLKKLKRKFLRRPRHETLFDLKGHEEEASMEHEISDEVSDENSEMEGSDETFMFTDKNDFEYAANVEQVPFEPGPVEFSCDIKVAERRLCEEEKRWAFDVEKKV